MLILSEHYQKTPLLELERRDKAVVHLQGIITMTEATRIVISVVTSEDEHLATILVEV
jgi:hypothetical protein